MANKETFTQKKKKKSTNLGKNSESLAFEP